MTSTILTLNIGSSSIKYALFDLADLNTLDKGKIICDARHSAEELSGLIKKFETPSVVAHRIVHGGDHYKTATLLNDAVLSDLNTFSPFAPLHQPHNLNGVRVAQQILPDVPQYGCFDTAFHSQHNALHATFALPADLRNKGLKRYGFHGLSYDWISRQVSAPRMVIAHLGSGASLCAVRNGQSIDSTMGLTALDGLPMATRSGSIDAGLILYLAQNLNYSPADIESILYTQSGLLGLSGLSGDVQALLSSTDPCAKFAIDYFVFKTAQHIAMMAVSLGGIDTLVFTGGIGENADPIRSAILDRLAFLPRFEHMVLPTNEEKMMAIQVQECLSHA